MTQRKTVKKTWYVDADAYSSLEAIAQGESRTMTQVVNEALRYYADRQEPCTLSTTSGIPG